MGLAHPTIDVTVRVVLPESDRAANVLELLANDEARVGLSYSDTAPERALESMTKAWALAMGASALRRSLYEPPKER